MKIKGRTCDICSRLEAIPENIQVVFKTDQTEGRACSPYLDIVWMDICHTCINKIIEWNTLYGVWAMGYNNYSFNKKENIELEKIIEKIGKKMCYISLIYPNWWEWTINTSNWLEEHFKWETLVEVFSKFLKYLTDNNIIDDV